MGGGLVAEAPSLASLRHLAKHSVGVTVDVIRDLL